MKNNTQDLIGNTKLVCHIGHVLVLKRTNSFGDLILYFCEDYGTAGYMAITFHEGSWPSMDQSTLYRIYRAN